MFPSFFASKMEQWRQGRYAARSSEQLLARFRGVSARHPEVSGRDLYRLFVMEHTRSDGCAADRVLDGAEESYALWPIPRPLTVCDVIHYLIVTEYLASHRRERAMSADIRHRVQEHIPEELCSARAAR